jgi:methylthioribose-1-phosphate isomerase
MEGPILIASCSAQGYGTALGVITYLFETAKLNKAYFTQSTPYHQGSRFVSGSTHWSITIEGTEAGSLP